MGIYRIYNESGGEVVGVIVARNKHCAASFALGKYGASASVARVWYKPALQLDAGVCELLATHVTHVQGSKQVRVIT